MFWEVNRACSLALPHLFFPILHSDCKHKRESTEKSCGACVGATCMLYAL